MVLGNLIQLQSSGPEEKYLYGNPQTTYFKEVYPRSTNFSLTYSTLPAQTMTLGETVKINIPLKGDLLAGIHLNLKFKDLVRTEDFEIINRNSVSLDRDLITKNPQFTSYVNGIGYNCIENIKLYINGSLIQELNSELIYIINEINNNLAKKKAFYKMTNYFDEGFIVGTDNIRDVETTLFIPFFFSKDPSCYLPLCALSHSKIEVEIKFRPKNKCVIHSYNTDLLTSKESKNGINHNGYMVEYNSALLQTGFDGTTGSIVYIPSAPDNAVESITTGAKTQITLKKNVSGNEVFRTTINIASEDSIGDVSKTKVYHGPNYIDISGTQVRIPGGIIGPEGKSNQDLSDNVFGDIINIDINTAAPLTDRGKEHHFIQDRIYYINDLYPSPTIGFELLVSSSDLGYTTKLDVNTVNTTPTGIISSKETYALTVYKGYLTSYSLQSNTNAKKITELDDKPLLIDWGDGEEITFDGDKHYYYRIRDTTTTPPDFTKLQTIPNADSLDNLPVYAKPVNSDSNVFTIHDVDTYNDAVNIGSNREVSSRLYIDSFNADINGTTMLTPGKSTMLYDKLNEYDYIKDSVKIDSANVIVEHIYLDDIEKKMFMNRDLSYLIELYHIGEQTVLNDETKKVIDMYGMHATKYLMWVLQRDDVFEANNYENYSYNFPLRFNSLASYSDTDRRHILDTAVISVNNIELNDKMDAKFFSELQLFDKFNCSSDGIIYMYSFALYPNLLKPSGSMNFSRVSHKTIELSIYDEKNDYFRDSRGEVITGALNSLVKVETDNGVPSTVTPVYNDRLPKGLEDILSNNGNKVSDNIVKLPKINFRYYTCYYNIFMINDGMGGLLYQ